MGMLIDGRWREMDRETRAGVFVRKDSAFRDVVEADPNAAFPAEPGRYHLYVSLACPWACRAVMVRALKRLETVVGMTVVSPDMLENGWTFAGTTDPLNGFRFLYEAYRASNPTYTGHVTVPILWDTRRRRILNNESSEIIRMFGRAFDAWGEAAVDLTPAAHLPAIDALNARIYEAVNNGVYKAGFATTQAAYEAAVGPLFAMLDELDARLATRRFLVGPAPTEADIRLFTTIVRFDLVYFSHFKCNIRQIRDYPNLSGWLRDVHAIPGIADTVDLAQIKRHYYGSQRWVNPTGIVPVGPTIDLASPAGRDHLP